MITIEFERIVCIDIVLRLGFLDELAFSGRWSAFLIYWRYNLGLDDAAMSNRQEYLNSLW